MKNNIISSKNQLIVKLAIIIIIAFLLLNKTSSILNNKQLTILSQNTYIEDSETSYTFRICFYNITSNFNYLGIKDEIEDISEFIDTNAMLYEFESPSTNSLTLKGVFSSLQKTMYFYSSSYKSLDISTTYCILLNSLSDSYMNFNLKHISLVTTTSYISNTVIIDYFTHIARIDQYVFNTQAALMIDIEFTLSPEQGSIYEDSEVSIDFFFLVTLPDENKSIPTSTISNGSSGSGTTPSSNTSISKAFILLTFKGTNFSIAKADITSSSDSTEVLQTKLSEFKFEIINTTQIKIYNLSEDLVNSRKIPMSISKIVLSGECVFSISTEVIWRNTNSVISSSSINIFSTVKREVSTANIYNINNLTSFYTKSNFEVYLSFSIDVVLSNNIIVLKNTNNKVSFISSTCDFSDNSNLSSAYCRGFDSNSSLSGYSELVLYNISGKAGIVFSFSFWIHTISSGTPTFTVEVENISNVKVVSIGGITITEAFSNTKESFSGITQCVSGSSTGCTNRLIVNENSGNFVLVENDGTKVLDLSPTSSAASLDDLKISDKKLFRLRFRNDYTTAALKDLELYANAWAGEWTVLPSFTEERRLESSINNLNKYLKNRRLQTGSYNLPKEDDLILGKHTFYFPTKYTATSNTKECKLAWGSTSQLRSGSNLYPDYSTQVTHISTENKLNNYKLFSTSSTSITSNKITFNNYDYSGALTAGIIFQHLVYTINCDSPNTDNIYLTCTTDNTPDDVKLKLTDFEISSDCVYYKDDYLNKSLYSNFDLMHTFVLSSSTALLRVNRFVSLLPQPGVFSVVANAYNLYSYNGNSSTTGSSLISKDVVYNNNNIEFPCLLEMNFTSSGNFYSTRENNRLVLFLLGIELIDFQNSSTNASSAYTSFNINYSSSDSTLDMIGYSNQHFYDGRVYKNQYSYLKKSNNGFTISSIDDNNSGNNIETVKIHFTNSDYRNYLGSVIVISNIKATSLPNDTTLIPIKCTNFDYSLASDKTITSYSFLLSELNYDATGYKLNYFYDNKNTDDTLNTLDFKIKPTSQFTSNTSTLNASASFDSFVLTTSSKLLIESKSTITGTEFTDQNNFFILMLNNKITTANFNIYSKEGVVIDSSFYRYFIINSIFSINNTNFNYLVLCSVKTKGTFFSGFVADLKAGFQVQGLNSYASPLNNNEIGVVLGGSTNIILSNYFNSSDDSSDKDEYIANNPSVSTLDNSSDITIKVEFVDNSVIKNDIGKDSICSKVTIKLTSYIYFIDIYSDYFTALTVSGEETGSTRCENNSTYFSCLNEDSFSKQTVIFFCNIDMSDNVFSISSIKTYFNNKNNITLTSLSSQSSTSSTVTITNTSKTPYINYTFTPAKSTSYSVPSTTYSGAKIDFYEYSSSQKTYGEITFRISSDYSVFRNMRMTIKGDISDLQINDYITPLCRVFFDESKKSDYEINFFTSCYIDFDEKVIVITTTTEVLLFTTMPKKFFISFFPVKIIDLGDISFSINSKFNTEQLEDLFGDSNTTLTTMVLSDNVVNISDYVSITNIYPFFAGEKSAITINVGLNNSLETGNYFDSSENNDKRLNQLLLFFPYQYYGSLPKESGLACYLGNALVESCYVINNRYIQMNYYFAYTQNLNITIIGLQVPNFSLKEQVQSAFLIQFLYESIDNETIVILNGVGKISSAVDSNDFNISSDTPTHNLMILSQSFEEPYPNSVSTLSILLSIDSINGINSISEVDDMKNTYVWLNLPSEISTTSNTVVAFSQYDLTDGEIKESVLYVIEESTVRTNFLFFQLDDSNYRIDSETFSYWKLEISNIRISNSEGVTDIIDITIFKRNSFILKTLPMLLTQYNSQVELDTSFGFITNNKGISISYNDINDRYFFTTPSHITTSPGIYKQIIITVDSKSNYKKNASTTLYLDSTYSLDYDTDKEQYTIDARFNNNVSVYLGLSCDMLNGKHFVYFDISNTTDFYTFPVLTITTDNSSKNKLRLFSNVNEIYSSSSSVINLSQNGFIYFWLQPVEPNYNQLNVSFILDTDSGTTVSFSNDSYLISKSSFDKTVVKYSILGSSIITKQTYKIVIDDSCFISEVSTVSFQASYVLDSTINEGFSLASITEFVNSPYSSNTSGGSSNAKYDLNSLVFKFSPDTNNNFPLNSNLFCTVYCSDLNEPDVELFDTLPLSQNTWYTSFLYSRIDSETEATIVFENLYREIDYKLKCLVQTSNAEDTARANYTEVIEFIGGNNISTKDNDVLSCISLEVTGYSQDFELEALRLIQDEFYFLDFEANGCVTAISENGYFIDGYNPLKVTCKSLLPDTEEEDSSSEDTSTDPTTTDTATEIISSEDSTTTPNSRLLLSKHGKSNKNKTKKVDNNYNRNLTSKNIKVLDTHSLKELHRKLASDTNSLIDNSIIICLTPKQSCSTNITSKKFTDAIEELLVTETSTGKSIFYNRLSTELQPLYVSYSLKALTDNITFPQLNIINNSDFKSSETKALINIEITLSSSIDTKLLCFWSLNSKSLTTSNISYLDIVNCNTTDNILCGKSVGVEIPANIIQESDINLFSRSEVYSFWITCKENLIIADDFSAAQGSLFTPDFPVVVVDESSSSSASAITECIYGNPEFPGCCAEGMIDVYNDKICYTYCRFVIVNWLILLFIMINII